MTASPDFLEIAHATGCAQAGGDGRKDGYGRLEDEFPRFLFHSIVCVRWLNKCVC